MSSQYQLKVGLVGISLSAYWDQFDGLKERLVGYVDTVASRLHHRDDIEIVNLGLVDSVEKGVETGHRFRQEDVDLIFLYVTTYALSSSVLPIVRRAKVPVIVLNLAPTSALDYASFNRLGNRQQMTAEWLSYCSACPVPEIANAFRRAGIPFFQVTGVLDGDQRAWAEIEDWVEAAYVAHVMEHNRLGAMGHYYGGMLDIYTDLTLQCSTFGGHIEMIEVDELAHLRSEVSPSEIAKRVDLFHSEFEIQDDCAVSELERAARTSVALDRLVASKSLGSMAYYYKGSGNPANEDAISSIILGSSLLTARGIPIAGEYEIKNAQAMKIMDAFGAGGSFSEYYAIDFDDDVVLFGHDGPGHIAIAEGKIKVRSLGVYHGKVGHGLSIEMSVKHGPVTLLSVAEGTNGKLKLIIAEGESVPGPILEIGNTNSRYRFPIPARRFVEDWNREAPAHHCAIGATHLTSKLKKFAALLNLESTVIC